MLLCAGLQSGGTTLISWCFLQRQDVDGVLDMKHDLIYTSFEKAKKPVLWVKMTIGAFRWLDVYDTYRDLGWKPDPLLVVRDARAAYSSLLGKAYGFNGTTAEEPPLRMRFRRFLTDWELFRQNDWPILRFEDVVLQEQTALRAICHTLSLPWDDDMTQWPKQASELAYFSTPNPTFAKSIDKGSLSAAILKDKADACKGALPAEEKNWLEETFAEYNAFHGYPKEISQSLDGEQPDRLPLPAFEGTRRQRIAAEIERLQWIPRGLQP